MEAAANFSKALRNCCKDVQCSVVSVTKAGNTPSEWTKADDTPWEWTEADDTPWEWRAWLPEMLHVDNRWCCFLMKRPGSPAETREEPQQVWPSSELHEVFSPMLHTPEFPERNRISYYFSKWGSMLYDTYEFWLLVLMYFRFSRGLRNRSARPGNSKWAWPSRCGRWCWLQRVSLMRVEFETWYQNLSLCLSAQSLWDFDSLNEIG